MQQFSAAIKNPAFRAVFKPQSDPFQKVPDFSQYLPYQRLRGHKLKTADHSPAKILEPLQRIVKLRQYKHRKLMSVDEFLPEEPHAVSKLVPQLYSHQQTEEEWPTGSNTPQPKFVSANLPFKLNEYLNKMMTGYTPEPKQPIKNQQNRSVSSYSHRQLQIKKKHNIKASPFLKALRRAANKHASRQQEIQQNRTVPMLQLHQLQRLKQTNSIIKRASKLGIKPITSTTPLEMLGKTSPKKFYKRISRSEDKR